MLVKKINPEWYPVEKRDLKVGEKIEITDPKSLIIAGDVVAIGENGEELSPYDLYQVLTRDEKAEFEEFKKMKSQEALKKNLEKEKEELEAALKAETGKKEEIVEGKTVAIKKK